MNLELPKEFILYDTEYTSWKGAMERNWGNPNEYREIIQIGALRVDGEALEERDSFNVFIKPIKNPQLSNFIIELTGITQDTIDTQGVSLKEALQRFSEFTGELPLSAYGEDADIIEENCKLLDIFFPFEKERCHNLRLPMKIILTERGVNYDAYTSGTLIEAFGKSGGRAHDAVNDMRNLLMALKELN